MKVLASLAIAFVCTVTFAVASQGVKGGCEEGYYYNQKTHECVKYQKDDSGHIIRPALEKEKKVHPKPQKGKEVREPHHQ
jgi:hypothetical protein